MIPETEPDQMSHWKGEEMLLCVFAGNVNGSVPERNIRFSLTGMYITELKEQHTGERDVFTSYFKSLPFWTRGEVVCSLFVCKYMSVGHCRCWSVCASIPV